MDHRAGDSGDGARRVGIDGGSVHLIEVGHGALQWWQLTVAGSRQLPVKLDEVAPGDARAALATSRFAPPVDAS